MQDEGKSTDEGDGDWDDDWGCLEMASCVGGGDSGVFKHILSRSGGVLCADEE